MSGEKITVRNPNHPGKTEQVDAGKYRAMEAAMLAVIPAAAGASDLMKPRGGPEPRSAFAV